MEISIYLSGFHDFIEEGFGICWEGLIFLDATWLQFSDSNTQK
jgi:hypothetical protein